MIFFLIKLLHCLHCGKTDGDDVWGKVLTALNSVKSLHANEMLNAQLSVYIWKQAVCGNYTCRPGEVFKKG